MRKQKSITILALHRNFCEIKTIKKASSYLSRYDEGRNDGGFIRYEVVIRYSNGDEIQGKFKTKLEAVKFLGALN